MQLYTWAKYLFFHRLICTAYRVHVQCMRRVFKEKYIWRQRQCNFSASASKQICPPPVTSSSLLYRVYAFVPVRHLFLIHNRVSSCITNIIRLLVNSILKLIVTMNYKQPLQAFFLFFSQTHEIIDIIWLTCCSLSPYPG